jgi:molybdate transport system substrate-binding protein
MKMKRFLLTFVLMLLPLTASSAEIYWYVAAGMLRPATEITERYNRMQDQHKVILITGGSGQLISKMRVSAHADVYLPASERFLEQIKELGMVRRIHPLLRMWPVFGLNPKQKDRFSSFDALAAPGVRLALGNPATMAQGEVYQRIETKLPAEMASRLRRNTVIESINIQQTVSYLHQGIVDAGLLFDSVAIAHGIPYLEIPPEWNAAVQAYLVELTTSTHPEVAAEFAAFVLEQNEIFTKHGFDVVQ